MTADIFSENVQTESNRMGIDGAEAPGPGVSPTTSSEDSFSFSDKFPNAAKCTSCRQIDAAGRRGVLQV